ncbi:MAG: class II fumarate hydratase [Ilumatobacteraceae bacterium]
MTDARAEPERLWGAQTELARNNFPIANRPLDVRVAQALATIKRHAAAVNASIGAGDIDEELAAAITAAALRVERGELDDHFPVDVYQTGSGTSTNMNVNEVLATLVGRALDDRVAHPNDHINASQSSNDTVPTAIRLAVARLLSTEVHPAVASLAAAFRVLGGRFRDVVKAGRTHLMDATPVTVGQEAAAWAGLLERALARSVADLDALGELPLGGTAVGTGINAPDGFASSVIARLAEETGLPLRPTDDPMVHMGGQGALAEASAGLRGIAIALTKIANDIRLLASGPSCGLAELLLPELQAGSSIMPGKVNPVLCESVNQVAARVFGNDATVAYAASQGILELNTYLPVMAEALLQSGELLANVCRAFEAKCVVGIEVDEVRCREYAERTPALATALNTVIGYAKAAELVHTAVEQRRSLVDVVVEAGVLDRAEAERILDPLAMTGQ